MMNELPPDPFFTPASCPIWSCEIPDEHTHDNDDPRLPLNRPGSV